MATGRPQLAELGVLERRAERKVIYTLVHTRRLLLQLRAAAFLREATLTSKAHNLAPGLDAQEDATLCHRTFFFDRISYACVV